MFAARWLLALLVSAAIPPAAEACTCAGSSPVCRTLAAADGSEPVFLGRVVRSSPPSWAVFQRRLQELATAHGVSPRLSTDGLEPQTARAYGSALLQLLRDYWRDEIPEERRDQLNRAATLEEGIAAMEGAPMTRTVELEVLEMFVGAPRKTIRIITGPGSPGDCSPLFAEGVEYLVFAKGEDGDWSTSTCAGTTPAEDARREIEYLRTQSAEPTAGSIVGRFYLHALRPDGSRFSTDPVSGATVRITDGERSWQLKTDAGGNYSLNELPPGEYVVEGEFGDWSVAPQPRSGWKTFPDGSARVTVRSKGCADVNFIAREATGTIRVRVVDALGNAASGVHVDLVPIALRTLGGWERSGANGEVVFREVYPGRYRLGVNVDRIPTLQKDVENPYPPTYYPGVDSAAAATEIRILPGQDASLDELRLPARLPPRPIQGRVLRADGGSIAGAYVELRMDGYSLDADSTRVDDESGRFELEGLARLDYSVSAYLREKDGTVWRGEAVVAERDAIVVLRRDE